MVHPVLESRLGAGSALLRQANALHAALEDGILEVGWAGLVGPQVARKQQLQGRRRMHRSPGSQHNKVRGRPGHGWRSRPNVSMAMLLV